MDYLGNEYQSMNHCKETYMFICCLYADNLDDQYDSLIMITCQICIL